MSKQMNYEEAMARLETIVQQMEQGELDIDSLAKQLTEAKKLSSLWARASMRLVQEADCPV